MYRLKAETRHPIWRQPRCHVDMPNSHDHVHWIELFYDLVHVVAIFVLGNFLSHHLSIDGFLIFAGLFSVFWFAWYDSAIFNSLYVSTDIYHRFLMTGLIISVMIMSSAISTITHGGWVFFAIAYAMNRAIIGFMYWRIKSYSITNSTVGLTHKSTDTPYISAFMSRNYAVLAVIYTISALLPQRFGIILFAVTVAIQIFLYSLPKVGIISCNNFVPRYGHLAERFALLVLIVCGEGFFKLIITLADKGVNKVEPDIFINYIFGAIALFIIAWIYHDLVGQGKPKNKTYKTFITWTYGHLIIMMSIVMIGVALSAEVKVKFFDPFPIKYAALGCVGLAVYLLSLRTIQSSIEERTAHYYFTRAPLFIGVLLAILTYFIVPYVPSLIGNLLWGSGLFIQVSYATFKSVKDFNDKNDW